MIKEDVQKFLDVNKFTTIFIGYGALKNFDKVYIAETDFGNGEIYRTLVVGLKNIEIFSIDIKIIKNLEMSFNDLRITTII